jgi:hypothetical protein
MKAAQKSGRFKLRLKQCDLISRRRRLPQNLNLAGIQHKRGGYRVPQPPTSRFQVIWRLKPLVRHTPTPYTYHLQGFYLGHRREGEPRLAGRGRVPQKKTRASN